MFDDGLAIIGWQRLGMHPLRVATCKFKRGNLRARFGQVAYRAFWLWVNWGHWADRLKLLSKDFVN